MTVIERPSRTNAPITFLGIRNLIYENATRVTKRHALARVTQPPVVPADDIEHTGVHGLKTRQVGGDDEVLPCSDRHVGKRILHTRVEPPAAQIDRGRRGIEKLD